MALPARLNPFAVERLHDFGYRDPETGEAADLGRLVARFDALGRGAALVGPRGHGKSTLLGDLARELERRTEGAGNGPRVVRIRARADGTVSDPRWLDSDLSGVCLLVDGADCLPRRSWRRLRRRSARSRRNRPGGGLLVTSHGRRLLPTLTRCATTPALVAALIEEILEDAPGPRRPLPPAAELWARHRGNVRLALLELYDLHAGR